ncbi:MAG: archaeosortase/exosortase family protein [Verrucomicrobiales bacterium]|nr:archaeosortase/exosortase family protein [Verrucomicrobiota bacterium JB025]
MTACATRRLSGAGLLIAALLVWCRDTAWLPDAADTLPLVAGLPLAWWFGGPWKPLPSPATGKLKPAAIAAVIAFTGGWLLASITLLAIAWTALAWCWTRSFFHPQPRRTRLLWLAILAFPWLVLEWPQLGWWFRLTSAAVAEAVFTLLQMPVLREGTLLNVMGVPINIEAACAGWNLLQLTLLAGVAIGAHDVGPARRFGLYFCLLPVLAWAANLIRILVLSGIALTFDVAMADGAIHGLTGLLVIAATIAIAKLLAALISPPATPTTRTVTSAR